jgi:hypothetical protein
MLWNGQFLRYGRNTGWSDERATSDCHWFVWFSRGFDICSIDWCLQVAAVAIGLNESVV